MQLIRCQKALAANRLRPEYHLGRQGNHQHVPDLGAEHSPLSDPFSDLTPTSGGIVRHPWRHTTAYLFNSEFGHLALLRWRGHDHGGLLHWT